MPPKIPRLLWAGLPLACFAYLFRLDAVGLLGPDEPRYASIAREMARSGDWITPRLWGAPWFEKPPLLYWMSGAAFRLGLGPELAPRLPVALVSLLFLVFYWWILNREFGCRTASIATVILGSCAGWMGVSQAGVTDLPLAATFSAAMLLALPWIGKGDTRFLPVAAVLLGLAVLAKSGVPLVLALPALWFGRRQRIPLRRFLAGAILFLAIALPWHVVCYLRNGAIFPYTLFVQHQYGRLTSGALLHTQPWWYYAPVFAGLLVPWTPLLALMRRRLFHDRRTQLLLAWLVFGLVFFSLAPNKLPAYLLPLLPAAAALSAMAVDAIPAAHWWLAGCAVLLVAIPIAAPFLAAALASGLSRAPRAVFHWSWMLPLAVAAAAVVFDRHEKRIAAVFCIAAASAAGLIYLKVADAPEINRLSSARGIWQEAAPRADELCVGRVSRDIEYGLNYYAGGPLPRCDGHPMPWVVVQTPGTPPVLERVDLK